MRTQTKTARELTRELSDAVKTAVFGSSGGDPGFESAFANLAHVNLRERAPKLLPYEVGFQLLDRSSDDTKAAGMFAFKMNDSWLYAPVFFLNGNLKGDELLFLKSQDIFIPLKDQWIDFVLNRKPVEMGKGVSKTMRDKGVRSPNFQEIVRPIAKRGSVLPNVTGWRRELYTEFAKLAYAKPVMDTISLPDFLVKAAKVQPKIVDTFLGWCRYQPQFVTAVRRYYDDSIFKLAVDLSVRSRPVGETNLDKYASRSSREDFRDLTPPSVRVYTLADMGSAKLAADLSAEEKETLFEEGMVVHDHRTTEEASVPVRVKSPDVLENPVGNGLYSILMKPGVFVKALVLKGLQDSRNKFPYSYVKFLEGPEKGNYALVPAKDLWAVHKYNDAEFRKFYDDLPEVGESLSTGSYDEALVLLGPGGKGTVPIQIDTELGGSDGSCIYSIRCVTHEDKEDPRLGRVADAGPFGRTTFDVGNRYGGTSLAIVGENGVFRATKDGFTVPKNFKKIEADKIGCCDRALFGNWTDIELEIQNKTAAINIRTNASGEFVLDKKSMDKTAAYKRLIENHGLDRAGADAVMDEVRHYGRSTIRIAYAPGFPKTAISAPYMSIEPDRGSEPLLGGQQVEYGMERTEKVPGLEAGQAPRPDPNAVQEALAASQSGSAEIFDAATFKGLVHAVREDDYVEEFTGDLIKAMDRLGRILMLFYWHSEDFEERYGREDLPEMEDTLKNTFESMGDLILKLRQRSIKSYGDSMGLDLAQSADN